MGISVRFDKARILSTLNHPCSDKCSHVDENVETAYAVLCEDDSFGPVLRLVQCRPCYREGQEARDNRLVGCHDCREQKPRKDTDEFRWYDFYAAQGDEPLIICKVCWELPKHKQRMKDDRAAEKEELG